MILEKLAKTSYNQGEEEGGGGGGNTIYTPLTHRNARIRVLTCEMEI